MQNWEQLITWNQACALLSTAHENVFNCMCMLIKGAGLDGKGTSGIEIEECVHTRKWGRIGPYVKYPF
jgi:hypothetical protein